jgi:hypothetical protein
MSIDEETLEVLIGRYQDSARDHGRATESGDYKSANEAYGSIATIHGELRRRGLEAQKALLALLEDAAPGVRVWAATHALEFAPSAGERVLLALAEVPKSLVGFSAKTTLKQWKAGRLQFF